MMSSAGKYSVEVLARDLRLRRKKTREREERKEERREDAVACEMHRAWAPGYGILLAQL